jgi:hypothetical protein
LFRVGAGKKNWKELFRRTKSRRQNKKGKQKKDDVDHRGHLKAEPPLLSLPQKTKRFLLDTDFFLALGIYHENSV